MKIERCGLLLEPLLIREQLKEEEVQVPKVKSPAGWQKEQLLNTSQPYPLIL